MREKRDRDREKRGVGGGVTKKERKNKETATQNLASND